MTARSVEAVCALYGLRADSIGITRLLPLREEDDLAEAWIRGDRTRVMEAVQVHEDEVRSRYVYVNKKRNIVRLKAKGWSTIEIARALETTAEYVAKVSRRAGIMAQRGRPRKLTPTVIFRMTEMRRTGKTLRQIAELEQLSLQTVCRALKLGNSSPSAATLSKSSYLRKTLPTETAL